MTSPQRTYKIANDRLRAYHRAHGLRGSKIRDIVLAKVCQLPQPFTAAQLEEACKEERISKGTIYNSLNLFLVAQILHAIKRQRGITLTEYEVVGNSAIRMEVICRKCGRTTEIHDPAIARILQERKYTNFIPQQYSLLVYGECKRCRLAKKKDA